MNLIALAPTTLPDTPPMEYLAAASAAGYPAVGVRVNRSPGLPFHPVMGDDPDWSRMRDNLARCCDMAMPLGLTAVLEFAITRPLATLHQTTRLIAESGRTNAAVCLDPLNMLRGTGGPELLVGLDPQLFPYAQITDGVLGPGEPDLDRARENGPNVRRLPGEGDVPLGEFLDALPAGIPLSAGSAATGSDGSQRRGVGPHYTRQVARLSRCVLRGEALSHRTRA